MLHIRFRSRHESGYPRVAPPHGFGPALPAQAVDSLLMTKGQLCSVMLDEFDCATVFACSIFLRRVNPAHVVQHMPFLLIEPYPATKRRAEVYGLSILAPCLSGALLPSSWVAKPWIDYPSCIAQLTNRNFDVCFRGFTDSPVNPQTIPSNSSKGRCSSFAISLFVVRSTQS